MPLRVLGALLFSAPLAAATALLAAGHLPAESAAKYWTFTVLGSDHVFCTSNLRVLVKEGAESRN